MKKVKTEYDSLSFDYLHEICYTRIKALTGEEWAPYPSRHFMTAVLIGTDKQATDLILDRRKYYFPEFLGKPDPGNQETMIKDILT